MKKRKTNKKFGHAIRTAIEDAKLRKPDVAEAAGMDISTLYRILNGSGVDKSTVVGLARTVNKLAGSEAFPERDALAIAGFENFLAEDANEFLIASIIDYSCELPEAVKEDLLIQIKALHRKYVIK